MQPNGRCTRRAKHTTARGTSVRMKAGAAGIGNITESDQGTGPATPVSPAPSAEKNHQADRGRSSEHESNPGDDGAAAFEIEKEFARRLAGVRRLPRQQRTAARRAAIDWRSVALKELRDKRRRERQARYALRAQCNLRVTPSSQPRHPHP